MLATLVTAVISGEAADSINRTTRTIVIYAIAGLLVLIGAGFLVGAGYVVAARELGHVAAALWFAGGFFLIAIIAVLVHNITNRRARRRAAERRRTELKSLAGASAIALLPALLAKGGTRVIALPALAAIGYAIYREMTPPSRRPPSDR